MDDAAREAADRSINRSVEALTIERAARRISGYLAFDGEPDIAPVLSRLGAGGVEVHLPVIHSQAGKSSMGFRNWQVDGSHDVAQRLVPNSFGIREPARGDDCTAEALDIVFMPLVAWDQNGGRLGMGAGYYDRALTRVAAADRPLRIGVAYDLQRAEAVPVTSADVSLHGVITESGLFTFRD